MAEATCNDVSMFQSKYSEFVEDLLGALPEYSLEINKSKLLDNNIKLQRFQKEVTVKETLSGDYENYNKNPKLVLPDVEISDTVWNSLSENTKKAIWEHLRVLSICCFMEGDLDDNSKPSWMDDVMNEMKNKLESVDFQNIINKFMKFFKSTDDSKSSNDEKNTESKDTKSSKFEDFFNKGFPKLPDKFLKGHLAKLAQEIVKDITPEDLGLSSDMVSQCEKDPSRAFNILFSTFTSNPNIIKNTIKKIGKRLQEKVMSGAIRPQEIAREAEELMKEFSSNSSFVEMMEGIKSAFGFEDMDLARKAGKEGSARLSLARDRLRKKLDKKKQNQNGK
jgi:hypothetical protein